MSFHRENVIWRSADGTWSRGFYDSYPTGSYDDPDYDPEWDVEYTDGFNWVSTGHPTQEAADQSWDGSNPGGSNLVDGDDERSLAERRRLDDKAWDLTDVEQARLAADAEARRRRNPYGVGVGYDNYATRDARGQRPYDPETALRRLRRATAELAKLPAAQEGYRLAGYGNDLTDATKKATARRADLRKRAEAAGVANKDLTADDKALLAQQVEALDKLIAKTEADRAERSRAGGYFGYGGWGRPPSAVPSLQPTRDLRDAMAAKLPKPRAKRAAQKGTTASAGTGRVPAGVPTGGQFAATRHREAEVDLE